MIFFTGEIEFLFTGEITTRTSALPYPKDTVDELSSKPAINDDSTISDTVTHGHHSNHSKTKFPCKYTYMEIKQGIYRS